ncbi:hypothetical protein HBI25_177630 [Parastagonospora nodorum]|nr:hypothetical protein HBH46_040130 [Parastagonospora nodorum]KAH5041478.1 hypothetical protein HBI75_043350 [Parastagonospora nodorum]KAH5124367.1 hypothetical protein HBH71_015780 [Parastagonospora nodorum]KAH5552800.1 hypothetical protein HBI25_177630 [Parastagonospora nodorum]KAH5691999.1 hypothetical protein HBI23_003680 [Parastagonospora nodorum]
MSAAIEPPGPSRPPSHKPHPYTNTQTRMYDLPADLSVAQLEAKKILAHLLERLKDEDSKYYAKYGKWVERHPRLEDFCFRSIRPQVWGFLNGRWSLDALKAVGGDLKYEGRGLYLDGVLGLDRRVRIYVGQAGSIRSRVGQHLNFRYRRDNPSLHYHAMQHSIYNSIGLIAQVPSPNMGNHTLPGMDCPDLLLNVLEMWMCLVFRSLPLQILDTWLPDDATVKKGRKSGQEGEFGGLNIAIPLDQGGAQREWLDLSECEDPLIREYLGRGKESAKVEAKEEEDSPEQRRTKYTEKARSYNKQRTEPPVATPPVAGYIFGAAVAFLIGAALLRGYASRPQGRWR